MNVNVIPNSKHYIYAGSCQYNVTIMWLELDHASERIIPFSLNFLLLLWACNSVKVIKTGVKVKMLCRNNAILRECYITSSSTDFKWRDLWDSHQCKELAWNARSPVRQMVTWPDTDVTDTFWRKTTMKQKPCNVTILNMIYLFAHNFHVCMNEVM